MSHKVEQSNMWLRSSVMLYFYY